VIGCPGARDLSVMPVPGGAARRAAALRGGGASGRGAHAPAADRAGGQREGPGRRQGDLRPRAGDRARPSTKGTSRTTAVLGARTTRIETPDPRLDDAFAWAKAGIDKGLVENPLLGTGFVAGFRTSGDSERPRASPGTSGATRCGRCRRCWRTATSTTARAGLDFLRKFQRADGKIPHEVSQAASLVPWFTDYKYPYESADATPLYVIAHAEHFAVTGDLAYLRASWPSIEKAVALHGGRRHDRNGLVENAPFGHGWTEGSPPYPPHEEIYLQGVWIEASRRLAALAGRQTGRALARRRGPSPSGRGPRSRRPTGSTGPGTTHSRPRCRSRRSTTRKPGPSRARRQARIEALRGRTLVDEDTVLPAVPLWWGILDEARAQSQIDHLGSASMATDWGARLISDRSELYDPLSYHYGSVWGLFTGWASVGAYRYGRPHVGYQALMANALLTYTGALGAVTELLSGDRFAPFGRSSHHQIWSQAMVVSPVMGGLFGVSVERGGKLLSLAPQLPASWDRAALRNLPVGGSRLDAVFERAPGRFTVRVTALSGTLPETVAIAPALPLDARVTSVTAGRAPRAVHPPARRRRPARVRRAAARGRNGSAGGRVRVRGRDRGRGGRSRSRVPAPSARRSACCACVRTRTRCDWCWKGAPAGPTRCACARARTSRSIDGVTVTPEPGGASLA
jgi:hypothetical protein